MAICKILKGCLSFYFSDIYFAMSPTLDDAHEFRGCGGHWCMCTVGILAPGRMVSSGHQIHLPLHHAALSLHQDLNPPHLSMCVSCSSLPDGEQSVPHFKYCCSDFYPCCCMSTPSFCQIALDLCDYISALILSDVYGFHFFFPNLFSYFRQRFHE